MDRIEAGTPDLVSVIIPSYNSAPWIRRAVDSARSQSYRPLDIIVVDDGSSDGTTDLLKKAYADCPEVRIIQQENRGVAAARNLGAASAFGQYLAFLDADDYWSPWKIEAQMTALRAFPNWGLCGTNGCNFGPGEEATGLATSAEPGEISLLPHDLLLRSILIWTSSSLLKRSVFAEAGGFDQTLRRGEDLDLWLKVAWRYDVVQLSAIHLAYQMTPNSLSSSHWRQSIATLEVVARWMEACPDKVPEIVHRRALSLTRKALRIGDIDKAKSMFFHEQYGRPETLFTRLGFRCLSGLCRLHQALGGPVEF